MRHRNAPLLLLIALAVACGGERTRVDLVEALADAEVFTETGLIDVGEPSARRHLLDGWLAGDERWAQRPDESFVWAVGAASSYRFFVFEKRDLVMTIRGRPNPAADPDEMREFGVEVNGQVVARHEITRGWNRYRAVVPRQVVERGENRARLLFWDGEGGEMLGRRLAIERVEFNRTIVRYPVRREIDAPTLIAPYLSGVWYTLDPMLGDRLEIAEIVPYGPHEGDPAGRLEVVLESASGSSRTVFEAGRSISLGIPADTTRIGLIAMPSGDPRRRSDARPLEEAVGLLLRRPEIVGDG